MQLATAARRQRIRHSSASSTVVVLMVGLWLATDIPFVTSFPTQTMTPYASIHLFNVPGFRGICRCEYQYPVGDPLSQWGRGRVIHSKTETYKTHSTRLCSTSISSRPGPLSSKTTMATITTTIEAHSSTKIQEQSTKNIHMSIQSLCQDSKWDDALQLLLEQSKDIVQKCRDENPKTMPYPKYGTYSNLLAALANQPEQYVNGVYTNAIDQVEVLWERMQLLAAHDSKEYALRTIDYESIILAWSKSNHPKASYRCIELLSELWSMFEKEAALEDDRCNRYCPSRAIYTGILKALARSGGGRQTAQQAEEIIEDMIHRSSNSEAMGHLKPTTLCFNHVLYVAFFIYVLYNFAWSKSSFRSNINSQLTHMMLSIPPFFMFQRNAWSKSGRPDAHRKCEAILHRMEVLHDCGRLTNRPDTCSFNTVLHAMSQSNERGVEHRAELLLLEKMKDPDNFSYNSILNCWARSQVPDAAQHAERILRQWEQRYRVGSTHLQPDRMAYNTVLAAWARAPYKNATFRNAYKLLRHMETSSIKGKATAKPNTISYNIVINALAHSNEPHAVDRAEKILDTMKGLSDTGQDECRPNYTTYTSLIDVVVNSVNAQENNTFTPERAANKAISFLKELEALYKTTGDPDLKPNIRTYTAVITAIARSRVEPERAEKMVQQIEEEYYATKDHDVQPDTVCYDALINAIGWSNAGNRAAKAYATYQKMLELYKSRRNILAKPDIVTCNAVLNACVYDEANTDTERHTLMKIVVATLHDFQASAPKFGRPDHLSYSNTLQAIARHVTDSKTRADLAEATFWQCCKDGHVSVLVVTCLHRAMIPWKRFSSLLGDALVSGEGESLVFHWRRLPKEWTRYAPRPKPRRTRRTSAY